MPLYVTAACIIFFACIYKLYKIHKKKQQRGLILFFSLFAFESIATAIGYICLEYYPTIAESSLFVWSSIANVVLIFAGLIAALIMRNTDGQIPAENRTCLKKQLKWLLIVVLLFAVALLGLYFVLIAVLK